MSLRRSAAVVAIAAAVMGVAACGGDDDDGSVAAPGTSPAAAKAAGAPLKIVAIASVATPGADNPQVAASAKAAADAINAKGGIKGRPIAIVSCNDRFGADGAAACAREAVADEAVAIIPNSAFGASIYPLLERARIPAVAVNPITPPDLTEPVSFPITAGTPVRNLSSATAVKQDGGKSIVGVVADSSAAKTQLQYMKKGADLAGIAYKGDIVIPLDATDYAPYVQQLKDKGADAAVLGLSSQQTVSLAQGALQQGLETTFVHGSSTIEQHEIEELMKVGAEGNFLIMSYLPPPTADVMKPYRDELDAAAAHGAKSVDEGVRGIDSQLSWLGVHAFAEAAGKVPGEITGASVLDVLNRTDSLELLNGAVTWKLGEAGAPPADAPRLTDGSMYVNKIGDDGTLQLAQPQPIDGLALLAEH